MAARQDISWGEEYPGGAHGISRASVRDMSDRFDAIVAETLMREPHRWPLGHTLPLKREVPDDVGTGYLSIGPPGCKPEPVVHLPDGTVRRYVSFEDLLAEGWRPD